MSTLNYVLSALALMMIGGVLSAYAIIVAYMLENHQLQKLVPLIHDRANNSRE